MSLFGCLAALITVIIIFTVLPSDKQMYPTYLLG